MPGLIFSGTIVLGGGGGTPPPVGFKLNLYDLSDLRNLLRL